MKRFRLSTLMLLIVIIGLCLALVVQGRRAADRAAEQTARQERLIVLIEKLKADWFRELNMKNMLQQKLHKLNPSTGQVEGVGHEK